MAQSQKSFNLRDQMENHYLEHISKKLSLSFKQVTNTFRLHEEGATIPFIARYRKEATGNLDEVAISNIIDQIKYFTELADRKETVMKTIEASGKLTPEITERIKKTFDATELEDIYLPFKPKRKTRAVAAIEKGLEPLATILFAQQINDPEIAAQTYVNDEVKDVAQALQGARDIIAEWIAENQDARNKIRQLFNTSAVISVKAVKSKREVQDAQKYRDYFEFEEPLKKCPSHRVLAIRRGEKEGFLNMDIRINEEEARYVLGKLFLKQSNTSGKQVEDAISDSYTRLLKPSIENEFRLSSKQNADEEAIKVFASNLEQLLLASPLGSKKILAIDPGFRTGCKIVFLDGSGTFRHNTTFYPHPPQNEKEKSIALLKSLVTKFEIEAIGIGNGTAGRETEQLVREIDFGKKIPVFIVNESGASVYSASGVAREEFPDEDVTVRGAISIGRRLLDPLSELVKIDPKSIGVGQYQHDVNQTKLKEELDKVVESCVNRVGVDLNTAGKHLLTYISGLSATLANNIVAYRNKNGQFRNREELKKVALMGPKSFEQSAGFLRIRDGENPLDNSAVHPESYYIVEKIAEDFKCSVKSLMQDKDLRQQVELKKYISEKIGAFTLEDILKELEKPGRDPRTTLQEFSFNESVRSIEDLKPGMVLPGVVTNITNFGVFVDIGVKQDGLIHISQLSDQFVSDPNKIVRLQLQVMVTVTDVDITRKRIALSMKQSLKSDSGKPVAQAERKKQKETKAIDPFHSKLEELKKKFKN